MISTGRSVGVDFGGGVGVDVCVVVVIVGVVRIVGVVGVVNV